VARKHRLGWYEKKSLELVTRNKKMVVITDKIHMMRVRFMEYFLCSMVASICIICAG
jgi:hypothetical protein